MPGQARLRVRYRDYASPWFDYLLVSPEELHALVDGTGWCVQHIIEGDPIYVAVLDQSGGRASKSHPNRGVGSRKWTKT